MNEITSWQTILKQKEYIKYLAPRKSGKIYSRILKIKAEYLKYMMK